MKIFVDANVLISVLNKEYPLFTYSSRIISLAGKDGIELFTSPVCLAIAFYFAEKKAGAKKAKQKIQLLCEYMSIAAVSPANVLQALKNPSVSDFEDGLEYYAAVDSKCRCIVTEDVGDFHFSSVEVLNCESFLKRHILK